MTDPDRLSDSPGVTGRLTDRAILSCVSSTLREFVLRGDDSTHARATLVQLTGLVDYAARREPDSTAARTAELVQALEGLAGNEVLTGVWPGEPHLAAADALAACVGRTDADADAVRLALRALLVRHLDDELTATAPLLDAFRGRLRDA